MTIEARTAELFGLDGDGWTLGGKLWFLDRMALRYGDAAAGTTPGSGGAG